MIMREQNRWKPITSVAILIIVLLVIIAMIPPPSYDYGLKYPTRVRKLTVPKEQAQIEMFAGAV
jgi:hypothetical protein